MRVVLFLCMWSTIALSQAKLVAVGEIGNANLPAQRIGADDLISISVYDSPELTRTIRVGATGDINLPMMKNPVHAVGLLPNELEKRIATALKTEQILVDPMVTVTVVEYRSRPISVTGAVRRSITFQAYGGVTLREALTRAEGLTPEAGPDILITRPGKNENGVAGPRLTERVAVRALIERGDFSTGSGPGLHRRECEEARCFPDERFVWNYDSEAGSHGRGACTLLWQGSLHLQAGSRWKCEG
jgi:protein involved in polysaccharide export with SLBB domain